MNLARGDIVEVDLIAALRKRIGDVVQAKVLLGPPLICPARSDEMPTAERVALDRSRAATLKMREADTAVFNATSAPEPSCVRAVRG